MPLPPMNLFILEPVHPGILPSRQVLIMDRIDSATNSVTDAIEALGKCDSAAAQFLWDRFFEQLCEYCKSRIYRRHRRLIESDEVATDAFTALFDGIRNQRFHRVRNRDELWQMLTLIAARKAINAGRRLDREKRGGGKVRGDSAFKDGAPQNIADYISHAQAPDVTTELQELSQHLLAALPSDELRNVALMRMAGHSNAEIAEKLSCVERTVERKMNLIRKTWSQLWQDHSDP